MKTALSAVAALLVATVAAQADPVGERAGTKAPERGAVTMQDRMPVSLQRDGYGLRQESRPIAEEGTAAARGWTGNDNEG